MALNINSVIQGGRVGHDPELQYTKNGTAVTEFTLYNDAPTKNKEGLKHRVILWNKNAENFCKFMTKGKEVIIEGYNKPESYEDKEGKTRTKHVIVGNKVTFIGSGDKTQTPKADFTNTNPVIENNKPVTFSADDIPF